MPNQSRRPSFPGHQQRWEVTPETRAALQSIGSRASQQFFANGAGGVTVAAVGAGMFHSYQSDPRNFTRNFSPRNDIETEAPPLAVDAKANPRDTIINAAAAVCAAEVAARWRYVQMDYDMLHNAGNHREDHFAVVRHNMARELVEKIKPDLVIREEANHWNGRVRHTCSTLVMTPDQLKAIIERVTSGIIAQCVANGWIK